VTRNMLVDRLESDEFDPYRRDHPGADEQVELAALRAAVRAAVAAIDSEPQRICLELRFYHGLSVAETAERLGITQGACKALQYRAIRSVRRVAPELEGLR
jgi:RNA polymerase sigma-70 factor, ECF subfamily